jgi:hypothetical protein
MTTCRRLRRHESLSPTFSGRSAGQPDALPKVISKRSPEPFARRAMLILKMFGINVRRQFYKGGDPHASGYPKAVTVCLIHEDRLGRNYPSTIHSFAARRG